MPPQIGNASHQGRHRPGEERNREEELFLRSPEALQRHRAACQGVEVGIVQDADAIEDGVDAGGDPRGSAWLTHDSNLRGVDLPERPGLDPHAEQGRGSSNNVHLPQCLAEGLCFRGGNGDEQGPESHGRRHAAARPAATGPRQPGPGKRSTTGAVDPMSTPSSAISRLARRVFQPATGPAAGLRQAEGLHIKHTAASPPKQA